MRELFKAELRRAKPVGGAPFLTAAESKGARVKTFSSVPAANQLDVLLALTWKWAESQVHWSKTKEPVNSFMEGKKEIDLGRYFTCRCMVLEFAAMKKYRFVSDIYWASFSESFILLIWKALSGYQVINLTEYAKPSFMRKSVYTLIKIWWYNYDISFFKNIYLCTCSPKGIETWLITPSRSQFTSCKNKNKKQKK